MVQAKRNQGGKGAFVGRHHDLIYESFQLIEDWGEEIMCNEVYRALSKAREAELKKRLTDAMKNDLTHTEALSK